MIPASSQDSGRRAEIALFALRAFAGNRHAIGEIRWYFTPAGVELSTDELRLRLQEMPKPVRCEVRPDRYRVVVACRPASDRERDFHARVRVPNAEEMLAPTLQWVAAKVRLTDGEAFELVDPSDVLGMLIDYDIVPHAWGVIPPTNDDLKNGISGTVKFARTGNTQVQLGSR